ncbi:MAG: 3-beta hydroxysteroid dehydrogenase, partial [Actinobacteria bacterium RBG_16_64_13]
MKIALIGATGFVGSRLLTEALERGHEVTGIVRHPDRLRVQGGLTAKKGDVLDQEGLAALLAGHDAVISAFSADRDAPDVYQGMVEGATAIIAATKKAGVKRLLVVGGAGSLEIAPGQQAIDQPDFPPEWKPGATGTRQFLYLLREEPDLDWTFLSPASLLQPGQRTGVFRLGGDRLLKDVEGQCRISLEDYA